MTPSARTKRLQRVAILLKIPKGWLAQPLPRQVWRVLVLASLALVGISSVYAWRELPPGTLRLAPTYVGLAAAIYGATYLMHTLGWHVLATRLLGPVPLRANAEALAASNLVKSLPTVAWYIASRTDFYIQRNIPRKRVVAASVWELALMIASGALLLLLVRAAAISVWLAALGALAAVVLGLTLPLDTSRPAVWLKRKLELPDRLQHTATPARFWLGLLSWYGSTWLLGGLFLWAIIGSIAPVELRQVPTVLDIWLLACLAGYAVSLSIGSLGIAREITLSFLVAQHWPVSVAIAAAIVVKLALTAGELGCSVLVLGWLHGTRKRSRHG